MALHNRRRDRSHTEGEADTDESCHDDESIETCPTGQWSGTRRRMDRRLPDLIRPVDATGEGLVVRFPHGQEGKLRSFDFGALRLPQDIAALLAHAVRNHPEPLSVNTQLNYWRAIESFARFVHEDSKIRSVTDLSTATVERYCTWLDCQVSKRTKKPPDYVPSSSALRTRNAIVLESSSETENRRPSGRKRGFGAA